MAMRIADSDESSIVAEINITPLTDVFLVLLIIFMVTSTAMVESGLSVKLPSAKSGSSIGDQTKPVSLTIGKDGQMKIGDREINPETMTETLRLELAKTTNKAIVIRGDKELFLGKTVEVMDAARTAGAERIAIATEQATK